MPIRFKQSRHKAKPSLTVAKRKEVTKIAKTVVNRKTETKWKAFSSSGALVDSNGIIHGLASMQQGNQYEQRDGSSVRPYNLGIRFYLDQNNTTVQRQTVRVYVVQMRKGSAAMGAGQFPSITGHWTPDQLSRARVLYDRVYTLNENGAAAPVRRYSNINLYGKKFIQCKWDAGSTTNISPDDGGSIHLVAVSDVTLTPPAITYAAMLKFKDL